MQHVHVENIRNQQVGARIAEVRADMKMTQADLAAEMTARLGREIRPLTVTRLEGGKRPIVVDELEAVAEALRVSTNDLLGPGDLPRGAILVNSASQEALRAGNALSKALREWLWARSRLRRALESKAAEALPASQLLWARTVSDMTIEGFLVEAQQEVERDDSAT
jgi:transcriptional regulator with XRE-family HTH domain